MCHRRQASPCRSNPPTPSNNHECHPPPKTPLKRGNVSASASPAIFRRYRSTAGSGRVTGIVGVYEACVSMQVALVAGGPPGPRRPAEADYQTLKCQRTESRQVRLEITLPFPGTLLSHRSIGHTQSIWIGPNRRNGFL